MPVKVVLSGASGFIGSRLAAELIEAGHELVILARDPQRAREKLALPGEYYAWNSESGVEPPARAFEGAGAVINLAGEPVGGGSWTPGRRKRIVDSRVNGTRALLAAADRYLPAGSTFISASAIGIYGDRGSEELTEASLVPSDRRDFLARVCREWEAAALNPEVGAGLRRVIGRIGIVLSPEGGALQKMLPAFRLGAGGRLGSGKQWMSWIHLDDAVAAIHFVLERESFKGVVNVVAPQPATNAEFSKQLGKAMGRPSVLPVPRAVLSAVLGKQASLVLGSQRVLPGELVEKGFEFCFPELGPALEDLLSGSVFEAAQFVPRPVEAVFEFFSNEKNLEELTPPWLEFEVLGKSTPTMGEGTVIDYKLKVHGVPMRWQSRIQDWKPNAHFVDHQIHGPYGKWEHFHQFVSVPGGTLLRDHVRYVVPGGRLGDAVAGAFVRKDIERIFEYRRGKIAQLFG